MRDAHTTDERLYAAFALLRAVAAHPSPARIAVNWYRVDDPEAEEAPAERCHLDDPAGWSALDAELLHALVDIEAHGGAPSAARLEAAGVLPPGTLWFGDPVPEDRASRAVWHRRALARTAGAAVVYLGPDAGLDAPVVRLGAGRDRRRVALDLELADYLARGQSVVCHQPRPAGGWQGFAAGLRPRLASLPGSPAPATAKVGEHGFLLLGVDPAATERLLGAARGLLSRASAAGWARMPIVVHEGAGLGLAQAGAPHRHADIPASPVERAIGADPSLSREDRDLLLATYRRLRGGGPPAGA